MVFLDHATTGDGLVAALQLLSIVLEENRPLSELAKEARDPVPHTLVSVRLPDRRPLEDMSATQRAMKSAEKTLGKNGRVLVRWSGTEPKLRVMVEGPEERRIRRLAEDICDAARAEMA